MVEKRKKHLKYSRYCNSEEEKILKVYDTKQIQQVFTSINRIQIKSSK